MADTIASLQAKIAKLKKEGASVQTIGRVQYKLNQLRKKKGTVKTSIIKTKSGTVKSRTGKVGTKKSQLIDPKASKPSTRKAKGDTVKISGLNGKSRVVKAGSANKVIKPKKTKDAKKYDRRISDLSNAELRKIILGNSGFSFAKSTAERELRARARKAQ